MFDKFVIFAAKNGIRFWQQVTNEVVWNYNRWLDDNDYSGNTQGLELTTIKQALKWMVEEELLPASCLLTIEVRKVKGTSTYCYSPEEVQAIVSYCRANANLHWMGDVVVALAMTGLRIGELVDLRWSNIDLEASTLHLRDTSQQARKSQRKEAETTKSHRDRSLPIHHDLLELFRKLCVHRKADLWVFHGPRGGRLKADTVRNIFKKDVLPDLADQFPGIDGQPGIKAGRLHSFRHYFISAAANENIPEPTLMEWVGHQDSKMVRHYYHLQRDESRRQMAKMPCFSSITSPNGEVSQA